MSTGPMLLDEVGYMRKSIRTRLVVAFVGLAVIPLLVVGGVLAWQSFTAQRQQTLDLQREIARGAATEASSFVAGLEQQLRLATAPHRLTGLDEARQYNVLSGLLFFGDDFEELALLDAKGREQLRISRLAAFSAADLEDRSRLDEFKVPAMSGETYYGPVTFDEVTGEPFMTMSLPLISKRSGLVDGILVAEIRLKEIWDLIASMAVGHNGIAYIVDQRGRVVAHRDPSVVLRGTSFGVPGSDGIHTGLSGSKVVLASDEVAYGAQRLTIVTERPVSEALALTIRTMIITAVLILAALVCAGLLGLYAGRHIVRPIRSLAATARAISGGELWRRAEATRQDELGVLGSSFNTMTTQLRDTIESLEQRVTERTEELTKTNVELETEIDVRKRVEAELRDREYVYQSLQDNAPIMMYSIDSRDGKLISINSHWLEVLGYERDEVIGLKSIDFVTPSSRLRWIEDIPEFSRTGVSEELEYQMVKKSGEVIDVLMSAVGLRGETGEITNTQVFLVDVTARKQAVIAERNRLAREIHDTLAQSLTVMIIQLENAGRLIGHETETARAELESAREVARHSLDEARRSVWDLHPVQEGSKSLTEEIRLEVGRAIEEGIHASIQVEGIEPEAMDARNKLAALRITQEALSNVRRHSKAKTAAVRISYGASGVELLISDDGTGFESSQTQGMLSPTGGGFGLTSTHERGRLAGGHIGIHSEPGKGTQIAARIPYQPSGEEPSHLQGTLTIADPSKGKESSSPIRILVVDDQEVVRRGIRSMLEQSDDLVVVGEAGDGEEALERVRTLAPDVVLLDVQMPNLDGVETTRRLREAGLTAQVILLSVYAKDEYIFDGLRAGARGYILKDTAAEDLSRAIRTVHRGGSLLEPIIATRLIQRLGNGAGPQLTDREMEVLRLLASGARNKQIADELTLSVGTVRFHLQNIYQKLDVQSRTQAVREATERRLLAS